MFEFRYGQKTNNLCLMVLKIDTKFEVKLVYDFKNNIKYFCPQAEKLRFHFEK